MIPSGSSVVWFGCKRDEKVPGIPIVVLARLVMMILFAATIKSRLVINLATAATISEVKPRDSH